MKKLLIVIAVLVSVYSVKAQENLIIYTDFEPDTCFTFQSDFDTLKFDLDQDGIGDVVMFAGWHSAVGYIAYIYMPSPDWQWSMSYAGGFDPLTDTTIISGNLGWQRYACELAMYSELTHFAFRHLTENGYYYGWAHIYVESLARICIDCMAYCTIPDYPLHWGQTSLTEGIDETESSAFATVHPNPTNGVVTIIGMNLSQAQVINMLGQQVISRQGKGDEIQINMSALPTGIYFINITDEEGRKCMRKVVKE